MRTIPVTFTQTISVEWRMGWMSLLHCLRTWQVLLTDKNLDEPLWAVRPPESASSHPFIREWATRTLELAGLRSVPAGVRMGNLLAAQRSLKRETR